MSRNVNAPARLQPAGAVNEEVTLDEQHTLLVWAARVLEDAMKAKTYQDNTLLGPTVRDFLAANRQLADRTLQAYEETLGWLCLAYPDKGLADLTTADLRGFIADKVREKDWSAATERQRTAAIKTFFRWAEEDEELIDRNPARKLRPRQVRGVRERLAYSQAVIDQLRDAQPDLRDRIAIQLLGDLGLRRNELRLLQLRDITIATGAIRVQHGKGGYARTVYTTDQLQSDLELLLWDNPEPDSYLLYPHRQFRQPYAPTSMHYWWKKCLERAGLPTSMLLHELRHSAATNIYAGKENGDLRAAQLLLGHQSMKTTEVYLHTEADYLRDAIRAR